MNRGQFSSDFITALGIFIVALILIGPIWTSVNIQTENIERSRNMQTIALGAADDLIRNPGSPQNWNTTNFRGIGLATEPRVLSANKSKYFFQLFSTNYTELKFMLGAGAFDLGVEIDGKNGTPVIYEGMIFANRSVPWNATEVANTKRLAVLKYNETSSEIVDLKLTIWRMR